MKLPTLIALTALAVGGLLIPRATDAQVQSAPEVVWKTNAHTRKVWSLAFSSEGGLLASGSEDLTAKVWTIPRGGLTTTVSTPQAKVLSVALQSPDDLLLTGGDDGAVREWSIPAGQRLWGGSGGEAAVWTVAFSPDGRLVAAGSSDASLIVANSDSSFARPFYGHSRDVVAVAFSPDSTLLASASLDGTARVWRVSDGSILYTITGHSLVSTNEEDTVINPVWGVDISPDGSLLATSGGDGTIRLWRMSDGGQLRVIPIPGASTVRFSPDGRLLFTLNGGDVNVWIVRTGQLLVRYAGVSASALAVCPSKELFAYGRGDGVLFLARFPLWVDSITQADGRVTLHWQGGSGRYQVQARRHLNRGDWHNLGAPTRENSFSHPAASHFYYRVVSLPNP